MRTAILAAAIILGLARWTVAADEPIFSGPQVGEKLPAFEFRGVYGEEAGKPLDVVSQAKAAPVVLVFVHEVTRPSVGLTRIVLNYAAQRKADGLHAGLVFLTDDATATEQWMNIPTVRPQVMPQGVSAGIFPDGKEGPGAYGLNRNVAVTVLVAKDDRVTANFALVQPSVQADARKIAKAIVDVLGGGEVPTLEQLGVRADARERPEMKTAGNAAIDAKMRELLGPLLRAATADAANAAAEKVDAYAADHADFAKDLGARAGRIVASDQFAQYGQTPEAREHLKRWAEKLGPKRETP